MTAEYFNSLAASWDARFTETDRAKLEKMAARLEIQPGASVIDIGSGTGIFVPFLVRKIGRDGRLTCLDPACEMLNVARSKGFEGNITFVCAGIEDSGLEDQAFDVAVCYSSFPHFRDKPRALAEISRLLKPGGRLFICHTSSREHINHIHEGIPTLRHDMIPGEVRMKALLSDAGFAEITIEDRPESYLAMGRKVTG